VHKTQNTTAAAWREGTNSHYNTVIFTVIHKELYSPLTSNGRIKHNLLAVVTSVLKASDCRHSNLAWINGDGCTGSRGRFRRRAESGSSDGTRGGTATGDRLKATGGRAARAAQRRHRVTVVGTGEAVEDEVDGVTHVEDGSCRKQLVADPVNRRWVLPMPVTS